MCIIIKVMQHPNIQDRRQTVLELANSKGTLRPRDVEKAGIPREYLLRLVREGRMVREGRGLYALPDTATSRSSTLALVAARIPDSVICLISALAFHGLTTQAPRRVWVAIANRKWEPRIEYPPTEVVRMSSKSFEYGAEAHDVNGTPVRVYSAAKTVADCFKFRNRVGTDLAIEALRDVWTKRMTTMDELWEAARVCRVSNVMRPYLESIV